MICRLDHGAARLFTRRGADWSERFPTLRAAFAELPVDSALLDGEVVYLGADGHTSFPKLASALQGGSGRDGRLVYYVFDLPYLNDYDLTAAPLLARKEALKRLLARQPSDAGQVRRPPAWQRRCVLSSSLCPGARGLDLQAGGRAVPRRSRSRLAQDQVPEAPGVVIGGFTARADSGAGVGSLLLGFYDEAGGPLRYAGRVGTGLNERTMSDLRAVARTITRLEAPFADAPRGREAREVTWVRPGLVAEVELSNGATGGCCATRLSRPAQRQAGRRGRPRAAVRQ